MANEKKNGSHILLEQVLNITKRLFKLYLYNKT